MLPRERSIFHIAGDDEAVRDEELSKSMQQDLEHKSVGLQVLLIQTPEHPLRRSSFLPVVTKSTMHSHCRDRNCRVSSSAFLIKHCFLCHKELELQKDIFMYREQSFCSVECREQKMTMDERNELEISVMARRRNHLHYHRSRESNVAVLSRRKGRILVT